MRNSNHFSCFQWHWGCLSNIMFTEITQWTWCVIFINMMLAIYIARLIFCSLFGILEVSHNLDHDWNINILFILKVHMSSDFFVGIDIGQNLMEFCLIDAYNWGLLYPFLHISVILKLSIWWIVSCVLYDTFLFFQHFQRQGDVKHICVYGNYQ